METYIPDRKYAGVVARITRALNSPQCDALVPLALKIDGLDRPGLADALLEVQPSLITGQIDVCDVKLCLGGHGDVWPLSIREHTG